MFMFFFSKPAQPFASIICRKPFVIRLVPHSISYFLLELSRLNHSDLDISLEFEDGPNAPQRCDDVPGYILILLHTMSIISLSDSSLFCRFASDASSEVLFPVEVWQHMSRIPWRRLQFRLPPASTYSFGAIKPVGHVSVIGKVLPMMGVTAREESFMELIIRLIDLDIRPATTASAPATSLQQARPPCSVSFQSHVTTRFTDQHVAFRACHLNLIRWLQVSIRDGSSANMEQLHDGLGLGDRRISVDDSRAVEATHAEDKTA